MGFEVYLKYEKSLRGFCLVSEIYSANLRAAKPRLRALTAASVPPFPPFGRRSLRFESALANIYCFKIKKTLFGKRAFIYMEIIGLAFRSATSCCLPTGRLRSLMAASVPPFPPFGRRSLRFESALANIYCFKNKKTLFVKRVSFFWR